MARPKDAAPLTPEEKAARKDKVAAAKLNRDRRAAITNVVSYMTRASAELDRQNLPSHVQWLDAAERALSTYREFLELSMTEAERETVHVVSASF